MTMASADLTTIAVSRETRDLLRRYGHKGQTYDDVIRLLIASYDEFMEEHYRRVDEMRTKRRFVRLKNAA